MVKIFSKLAVLSALSLLVANCAKQNPVSFKDSGTQEVANASFTPAGPIAARLGSAGFNEIDGRVWLIARSTDNQAWYRSKPSNGGWTNWTAMSGAITGNIAMANSADGILAFSKDQNNNLNYTYTYGAATLHNWINAQVSGVSGNIAAINGYNDYPYVFFRDGTTNSLYVVGFLAYYGNGSKTWRLGGSQTIGPNVAVGKNQDGRLEAFATNSANQLVHIWQTNNSTPPDYNNWYSSFDNLGGNIQPGSDIAVGTNADGRLEVFVTWADGSLYHIKQVVPNGGWGNWAQISTSSVVFNTISVGKNSDGRLETIFRTLTGNYTMHLWQLAAGGTTGWSAATTFTANYPVSSIPNGANIAITNFANGALVAFVFGSLPYYADPNSPNICYTYQDYTTQPDGWSPWAPLQ